MAPCRRMWTLWTAGENRAISRSLWTTLAIAVTTGCAALPPTAPPLLTQRARHTVATMARSAPAPAANPDREAVLTQAREMLGGAPMTVRGFAFEPDPIGFVRAAYWAAGIDLFDATVALDSQVDGMAILFRSASARGQLHGKPPRPGDLVFFDAAAGATDLYPVQVGIVENTGPTGTVTVLGSFAQGPARVALNLRTPERAVSEQGMTANSLLTSKRTRQATAARLFRSFADPF